MNRAAAFLVAFAMTSYSPVVGQEQGTETVPVAILGDSDSHSYAGIELPRRGGSEYRPVTLQWTEILHRLRGSTLDFGEWGTWGLRYRYVLLRRLIGLATPYPPKEDFRYNLAMSNARCEDLTSGRARQLPPLIALLEGDDERWSRGVVVIRIGINSLSSESQLDHYATRGLDPVARQWVDDCLSHITRAFSAIRATSRSVRIVLVGIAEDINTPLWEGRWASSGDVARIRDVLDYFDRSLIRMAEPDPRAAFLDDRAWRTPLWGARDSTGVLRTTSVQLSGPAPITNTIGDHPSNRVTGDGHAGTVANGFFANELIRVLNEAFGMQIRELSDDEIAQLADPDGEYGIASPNSTPRQELR